MIQIGNNTFAFGKYGIVMNGQVTPEQHASFAITGCPCIGGAGIFTPQESAAFKTPNSFCKVYFGRAVNYKKLTSEDEIVKFIRRRVQTLQKVAGLKTVDNFEFHGHNVSVYRKSLNVIGAAAITEALTGAEFVDGHGIFSSDRFVTVEAFGERKEFDFPIIGLALGEADEIKYMLENRLKLVRDWVESVRPAPEQELYQKTIVINIMEV